MPTRAEMQQLVDEHARLDEPMTTAIWIKTGDREAWLVEVVPTMGHDEHPEHPVAFNPGLTFRHPLNLIVANYEDLTAAIRRDSDLANAIANGIVLYGPSDGDALRRFAKGTLHGAA
jgi:hypothetical protein